MVVLRTSRGILALHRILWALGLCVLGAQAALGESAPNVIVILADDMGYGDLGVYGNSRISTPNIDSIAAHGVRFTNGYVTAPLCSPSRAGLMTGRYQQRYGLEFNPGIRPPDLQPTDSKAGMPTDQLLFPQLMKNGGYATGLVGKWHLGGDPQFLPQARGFDEFFGFLNSQNPYTTEGVVIKSSGRPKPNHQIRGTKRWDEPEYLTDAYGREAVDFIQRHHEAPFFLYVPFNATQEPLQATQNYLDRVKGIDDPRKRTYAAMTIALDDAVGRILHTLEETKILDNTLVVFLSDNGGVFRPGQPSFSDNGPLRAGKLYVHEGGIRIPFMMQWPGHIEGGTVYHESVSSMDVLPTALAAAGIEAPQDRPPDGVDLLPYLTKNKKGAPHEILAWRLGRNHALRNGDWKFLQYAGHPPKLFNLPDDPSESIDLAHEHPRKLKKLVRLYAKWESEMIAPVYGPRTYDPLNFEGEELVLDY